METYRERKQKVYRALAQTYDDTGSLMAEVQALTARISFVAEAFSGVRTFLDLGCGAGDLLRTLGTLLGENAQCVGLDLSPEMLSIAQHKIDGCPRTYVIQTDVTQRLPFPDDTFDLVASLNLLQEVSAPTVVLEEVQRILRPGGAFRGVTVCYAGRNAAELVHQAVARRHTWYFHPAEEMLAVFQKVFSRGVGHFEPFPHTSQAQMAGRLRNTLFSEMSRKVEELGHNPAEIRLGALLLDGKKG
jgi:ubiquinone/menaquinone biosynthesis C-methylase UbiE